MVIERNVFSVFVSDQWIATDAGRVFARTWVPSLPRDNASATLLLFHDSLGSVDLWRKFPEQLAIATGRSVVAYDRVGFGRSDPHPARLELTFIRDEAVRVVPVLLDALELDAIIPFGHSVGGGMAVETAARFPERCAAVITESAQAFVEELTLGGVRAAQAQFERPGQVERLARYHGEKARWVLDAWIETWLDPRMAAWCLDDALRDVNCPTLALHGDLDEYGSVEHPRRIARLTQAEARAVIIEACGHVPHREQLQTVLSEVSNFLMTIGTP